jgi:hypothetical protein
MAITKCEWHFKEVNHNANRFRAVSDQSRVQRKTILGKHDEHKSKISEWKKKRDDGIYLQSGRTKYYQEAARKE